MFKKEHLVIHEEKMDPVTVTGDTKVYEVIEDVMMKTVREKLNWPGYGLWCGHEPVNRNYEFDDLRYLRKPDGSIIFEVENHECRYRPILIKPQKSEKCIVCLGPNDGERSFNCMHQCFCAGCAKDVKRCPLCRKRDVPREEDGY